MCNLIQLRVRVTDNCRLSDRFIIYSETLYHPFVHSNHRRHHLSHMHFPFFHLILHTFVMKFYHFTIPLFLCIWIHNTIPIFMSFGAHTHIFLFFCKHKSMGENCGKLCSFNARWYKKIIMFKIIFIILFFARAAESHLLFYFFSFSRFIAAFYFRLLSTRNIFASVGKFF